jgi:cell division protein FtsB
MARDFYRPKPQRLGVRGFLRRLARKKRLLFVIGAGLLLTGFALFGNRGVLQRIRLENRKAQMEDKIRDAQEENRRLQSQSKALDGDTKAIEKVARENHGMHRKGETVYKVKKREE